MTEHSARSGGCACGRVRFEAAVASDEAYLCHCRMCQRATGSVSIAFVNLPQVDVRWRGEPAWWRSSALARRPFCATCGTSLGFAYLDSDKMDLTVAAFDDPAFFRCTAHFGVESRLEGWWHGTEGLLETRSDSYQPLLDRWRAASPQG